MDRLRRFRRKPRVHRDVIQTFFIGKCHVCKQQNASVGNLKCKKHNYCQLCAQFVPRFIKGDFTCKICLESMMPYTPVKADKYRVMDEVKQCGSNPSVVSTDRYVSPQQEEDNSDLEGNNEELDKLLYSLIQAGQPPQHSEHLAPIPRKRSFLYLTLPPTADPAREDSGHPYRPDSHANNDGQFLYNNYVNGLIERSRDYPPTNEQTERVQSPPSLHIEKPAHEKSKQDGGNSKLRGTFQPDPREFERGSSPCKGLRPRSVDSSLSETEQLIEMIGQIDGPDETSSSSSRSGSSVSSERSQPLNVGYDEFWGD